MNTALITGANRGLGLELVKQYALKNWSVIACCRNPDSANALAQLEKSHSNITLHELDVTNESQILALEETFKGQAIDVLIHNAGVDGSSCDTMNNMGQKEWLAVLSANTVAPALITQALLENILASQHKTVVGITSILASIDDNRSGGR